MWPDIVPRYVSNQLWALIGLAWSFWEVGFCQLPSSYRQIDDFSIADWVWGEWKWELKSKTVFFHFSFWLEPAAILVRSIETAWRAQERSYGAINSLFLRNKDNWQQTLKTLIKEHGRLQRVPSQEHFLELCLSFCCQSWAWAAQLSLGYWRWLWFSG